MNELRRFGGFSQMTPIVKKLIITNVIVFAACYFMPDLNILLSMHYPTSELFRPWQLLTHMFMHGSIAHIFLNMLGLFTFGSILERLLGPRRFITLYFLSGFSAIGLHLAVQFYQVYAQIGSIHLTPDLFLNTEGKRLFFMNGEMTDELLQFMTNTKLAAIYLTPLVGASGAIYGLTAGFAYLFPNTELMLMFIPFPIKAKYLVPLVLIVYDLGYGTLGGGDNVAHFAHIGGAIFGFLLVYYWNKTNRNSFW
ncbi:MAG: rhomboid family intramembrane serine protease [Chitinophagales bacterium]